MDKYNEVYGDFTCLADNSCGCDYPDVPEAPECTGDCTILEYTASTIDVFIDVTLDIGDSVTYQFKPYGFDTCEYTYIVEESDTDLYEFTNFNVLAQYTDISLGLFKITGGSKADTDGG